MSGDVVDTLNSSLSPSLLILSRVMMTLMMSSDNLTHHFILLSKVIHDFKCPAFLLQVTLFPMCYMTSISRVFLGHPYSPFITTHRHSYS